MEEYRQLNNSLLIVLKLFYGEHIDPLMLSS